MGLGRERLWIGGGGCRGSCQLSVIRKNGSQQSVNPLNPPYQRDRIQGFAGVRNCLKRDLQGL